MADDRLNSEPNNINDSVEIERPIVASSDPADQIPVPIAMSPAEIDERAQAVQAVRGTTADIDASTNPVANDELRAGVNRPDAVIETRPEEPRIDV